MIKGMSNGNGYKCIILNGAIRVLSLRTDFISRLEQAIPAEYELYFTEDEIEIDLELDPNRGFIPLSRFKRIR